MGCSGSIQSQTSIHYLKEEDRQREEEVNKNLSEYMSAESKKESEEIKLLFLGTGGSGKSTLFKQLKIVHSSGFDAQEKLIFVRQIHFQMMESMKLLLQACIIEAGSQQDSEEQSNNISRFETFKDDIHFVFKYEASSQYSTNAPEAKSDEYRILNRLWTELPVIKAMYHRRRNELGVADSTEFFMDAIDRIYARDYVPSNEDLLFVRSRSVGLTEKVLMINDYCFRLCDVGGQRNERRKWRKYFDHVKAVVFVIGLSCYDELTIDTNENGMTETIAIYKETVNCKEFTSTSFILFFNKSDIFETKILQKSLKLCPKFHSFKGPDADRDAALDFIDTYFFKLNKNQEREVWTHITNATDKENVTRVFNDVQQSIVHGNLRTVGL